MSQSTGWWDAQSYHIIHTYAQEERILSFMWYDYKWARLEKNRKISRDIFLSQGLQVEGTCLWARHISLTRSFSRKESLPMRSFSRKKKHKPAVLRWASQGRYERTGSTPAVFRESFRAEHQAGACCCAGKDVSLREMCLDVTLRGVTLRYGTLRCVSVLLVAREKMSRLERCASMWHWEASHWDMAH